MTKKDSLRKAIQNALEAYELAATPRPNLIFQKIKRDPNDELPEREQLYINRDRLLRFALDMKYMLSAHYCEIKEYHGEKRAYRLIDYLQGKPLSEYSWHQRQEVIADTKALQYKIRKYKRRDG